MDSLKTEQRGDASPLPSSSMPEPGVRKVRLFCAAMAVALEEGFGHVTLTSVARRAGISKGGLLYHFSTKRELIEAMLHHYGHSKSIQRSSSPIDPLAVSVLIAAAESPSLLTGLEKHLDVSVKQNSSVCDDRCRHAEWMLNLINLVQLKRPPSDTSTDLKRP